MTYQDEFDSLLHDALSEYRDAEPLAGLEERVLRRLGSQREKQEKPWRLWGAAVACAVIIAVAAGIAMRGRMATPLQPEPKQPQTTTASAQAPDAPATAKQPALGSSRQLAQTIRPKTSRSEAPQPATLVAIRHQTAAVVPDLFPTPTPLSLEEHALLALARTHPEMLFNRSEDSENDGKVIIPLIDIKLLPEPNGDSQGDD